MAEDLNCRVAKVEQRLDGLCRELNEDRDEVRRRSDKVFLCLDDLKRDSANNKGFFGGVVFAVGAIFAVIVYVFNKS
jgi:uncharacterized coiled-coil protein SlyX